MDGTAMLTIAVLTFQRPDDLTALLPLLMDQCRCVRPVEAEILVVDNDPQGSAAAIVAEWSSRAVIRYVHEERPGIAAARNRALDEAVLSSQLVFIDDDERPGAEWLARLLALQAQERCAGVVGPVVSHFMIEPDAWIVAGQFFRRRRMATGTRVDVAATNNLLLDLERVRAHHLRFDERFGLLGGEDTLFTRALVNSGESLTWCDEAVVTDVVPAARLTRSWVLWRAFSSGNTAALVDAELHRGLSGAGHRVRRIGVGLIRATAGCGRALMGYALQSTVDQAKGCRTAARGAGMIGGALGYRFSEYRRL